MQSGRVRLAAGLIAVYAGLEFAIGVWAFTLLTEGRHYGTHVASASVSGFWAALIMGRVALAIARNPWPLTAVVRVSLAALIGCTALLAAGFSVATDVTAIIAGGLAAGPVFPSLLNATACRFPADRARGVIAVQTAAATAGQALVPATVGAIGGAFGLASVTLALVACASVAMALHQRLASGDEPARADVSLGY